MTDIFYKFPADLLTDKRITDGDRTVYIAVLSFCDYGTTRNAFPSTTGIAARLGRTDRSSVVRSINRLVEAGWLTKETRIGPKGQTSSRYGFPRHPKGKTSNGEPDGVDETPQRGVDETPHDLRSTNPTSTTFSPQGAGAQSGHDQEPYTHSRKRQNFTKTQASVAVMSLILDKAQQDKSDDILF